MAEYFGKDTNMRLPHIGLICLIRHIKSNQNIMVANTHIYANPSRDFVKLAQTFCFMQHISSFLENLEQQNILEVPVIMCGDWNSRPKDSSIHLIMNKKFYADPVTGRQ